MGKKDTEEISQTEGYKKRGDMSMKNHKSLRLMGNAILVGGFLILESTILHPLTLDPWNGNHALERINHSLSMWVWDHSLMMIAMLLWYFGLLGGSLFLKHSTPFIKIANGLFILSVTVWMVVLTAELASLPALAIEVAENPSRIMEIVWKSMFAFGLLGGYFAVLFTWISIFLLSLSIKKTNKKFTVLKKIGVYGGLIGALGIVISIIYSEMAILVLPITSGIPFIWTLMFGWIIRKEIVS